MKNEIYNCKPAFKLVTIMLMCLAFSGSSFAQSTAASSSEPPGSEEPEIPDGALFYEQYEIEESTDYLFPEGTIIEEMTEWDWIEMRPNTEIRKHRSYTDQDFYSYSRIDLIETDMINEWDHKVGHLEIDPDRVVTYNSDGEIISDMPHSEDYLNIQGKLRETLMSNGFTPTYPFPAYEELPIEDIQSEGYQIESVDEGYRIWNDTEEAIVNTTENTRIFRVFWEEYDTPYYVYENFDESSQGYLFPVFQKTMTKILSENGGCVIKVDKKTYSDYELYYDPSAISEGQEEPTVYYDFSVFPNPADDYIEISYTGQEFPSHSYRIVIFNHMGEPLIEHDLNTDNTEHISVNELTRGYYFIQFSIEGHVFSKKIFKK